MTTPSHFSPDESNFVIEESSTEMAWLLDLYPLVTTGMGGLFPERADTSLSDVHDILDLGCGPGGFVLDVARAYPEIEVTGVDVSQQMVDYARAHAQARRFDNAHFHVMNVLKPLGFPDNSFDLVNARTLFAFMTPDTWPLLLQECMRVTRPGGIFRLTEPEIIITTSPACQRIWKLLSRALYVTGRSFSSDGGMIEIIPQMTRLLREASFQHIRSKAYPIDQSAGTVAFAGWYQNYQILYKLMEPFLFQSGVINAEEYEQLYQQAFIEMLSEDFSSVAFYLTAWGQKL